MTEEYTEASAQPSSKAWGACLVEARESIPYTREQVASELNLPPGYIEILEQGGLEGLPSIVFAKGYIRAYAKLLHLDSDELIAEYELLHGVVTSKGQIRPVGKEHHQVKMSHPVMKLTSWLIVLAIIGVSVWWWQAQYGSDAKLPAIFDEPQTEAAENNAPVVNVEGGTAQLVLPKLNDEPEPSGEAVEEQSEETETQVESESVAESEPEYLSEAEIKKLQQDLDAGVVVEAETVQEVVLPEVSADVSESNAGLNIAAINAEFVAECWVSIKDADGKTLFNNLRGKGQSVSVSGSPPLNVLIGAADAVGRFSFNGEEIDLAQHSRKNIVRINLPLDE